jgi:hypothetical protein
MSERSDRPYVKVLWLPTIDANVSNTFDVFVDIRSILKFLTFGCTDRNNPSQSGLKGFRVKLLTAAKNPLIDDWATAASLVGEQGQRIYRLPATPDWIITQQERLFLEYAADIDLNQVSVGFHFEPACRPDSYHPGS